MSSNQHNGHKERVEYSTLLMRSEVVDQLEAMLKSLRKGYLTISNGPQAVELCVGDHVRFEFQAKCKGQQESLHISLHWNRQDSQDRLCIGTAPAERSHNAPAADAPKSRRRPAAHPPYAEWTREELYERAKELEISGRSVMTKDELIAALREQ